MIIIIICHDKKTRLEINWECISIKKKTDWKIKEWLKLIQRHQTLKAKK